jgi:hypothetical protein
VFCGRLLFATFPEDRRGPLPTRPDEYRLIVAANVTRPRPPVTHRRFRRNSVQPSTIDLPAARYGTRDRNGVRRALGERAAALGTVSIGVEPVDPALIGRARVRTSAAAGVADFSRHPANPSHPGPTVMAKYPAVEYFSARSICGMPVRAYPTCQ